MAGKNIPQFLRFGGNVYEYTPTNHYELAKEVIVKPGPFDVKQVDAAEILDFIKGKITETSLAQELNLRGIADAIARSAVQNISITSAERETIDAMASEAYQQQGYPLSNEGAERRWKAAYEIARLRLALGDSQ